MVYFETGITILFVFLTNRHVSDYKPFVTVEGEWNGVMTTKGPSGVSTLVVVVVVMIVSVGWVVVVHTMYESVERLGVMVV